MKLNDQATLQTRLDVLEAQQAVMAGLATSFRKLTKLGERQSSGNSLPGSHSPLTNQAPVGTECVEFRLPVLPLPLMSERFSFAFNNLIVLLCQEVIKMQFFHGTSNGKTDGLHKVAR